MLLRQGLHFRKELAVFDLHSGAHQLLFLLCVPLKPVTEYILSTRFRQEVCQNTTPCKIAVDPALIQRHLVIVLSLSFEVLVSVTFEEHIVVATELAGEVTQLLFTLGRDHADVTRDANHFLGAHECVIRILHRIDWRYVDQARLIIAYLAHSVSKASELRLPFTVDGSSRAQEVFDSRLHHVEAVTMCRLCNFHACDGVVK